MSVEADIDAATAVLADLERMDELERLGFPQHSLIPGLDTVALIAAKMCGTTVGAVNFITDTDQLCGGSFGISTASLNLPRRRSLCDVVVQQQEPVFLDGMLLSITLADRDLTQSGIGTYLGIPVKSDRGVPIGTVSVIDRDPKRFDNDTIRGMVGLAQWVTSMVEAREPLHSGGRVMFGSIVPGPRSSRD